MTRYQILPWKQVLKTNDKERTWSNLRRRHREGWMRLFHNPMDMIKKNKMSTYFGMWLWHEPKCHGIESNLKFSPSAAPPRQSPFSDHLGTHCPRCQGASLINIFLLIFMWAHWWITVSPVSEASLPSPRAVLMVGCGRSVGQLPMGEKGLVGSLLHST